LNHLYPALVEAPGGCGSDLFRRAVFDHWLNAAALMNELKVGQMWMMDFAGGFRLVCALDGSKCGPFFLIRRGLAK
jgi:hypothetical protein